MHTSRKSELPYQDPVRKPNKNCMIRTSDAAKTKMETAVTQLADDSVSLDLRLTLISQIREAFTYVNEITEENRRIINKLDHFQNNSITERNRPNESKEITDCKFQEKEKVQYPMETGKLSVCARAIETADKLSRKLDAFCKCFEEQTGLERRPTSASQSNSVTFDQLSVVFRSGLRRKHIYGEDDNSVVLFLSGDIHKDRKSPFAVQAPNFSKVLVISSSKNLKADKLQQYPSSSTSTTTTIFTTATTKETHSANASTMQITAKALPTKATIAEAPITITTKGKPERATSQACPSASNINGQLRRNQTNIKDDNRLVSYEGQIERQVYSPLAKNKNDGKFLASGGQNRFNGLKGAGHQFVQNETRVLMSEKMVPKENRSSEQGSQNPDGYRLDSDQTHIAKERVDSMKIHKNARETVSAEDVVKGEKVIKSQASVPTQWKGKMDTQDRVCYSEIPKKCDCKEGKISKPSMKQTDANNTEYALASTKKYNMQEGADGKMDREDSISASELSRAQGNSRFTLTTFEPLKNNNGDKSVRHTSEMLKKESVTKDTLLSSKLHMKERITRDKMSTSDVSQKHSDDPKSKSTSKLRKKHVYSKETVPTSGISDNIPHAEETAFSCNTIAPQDEKDTAQGLDLMPMMRQFWEMFSGDSGIFEQLDAAGMKMELLNADVTDPNKPFQFKYKLEEFGFEQTVDMKMNDMLALQAQVGLDGSQPFPSSNLVDLDYWTKFCEEEVEKGKRYRIDDDSIDTVLCIDISSSMKGEAWGKAMDFARNFVRGIKANPPNNVGVQEKIALVTFGHITKIHKHLTTDYDGILRLIDHLYPDGPSPMIPGFLLSVAAIEACGKTLQMRGLTVFPRIIMITDGIPTSAIMLKDPDITFAESLDQKAVEMQISASRMDVDFQIFCVPVGDNRLDFLKTISKCTGGKVIHAGGWKSLVRWSRNLSVASRYIDRFKQSECTFSFERLQKENSHLSSKEVREIRKLLEASKKLSIAADNNNGQVDIPIGTRVRRGPDWNRGDEDGGGPGTVIGEASAIGHLQVVWDASAFRRNDHIYRYGQDIMEIVPVNEPRILSPGENMAVGCYVERGRDWQHGNQDGGSGNIGIVIYFNTQTEIVHVIWPNGGVFSYKFGENGRFEIRVSSISAQPRNIYEIPANVAEGISGTDEQSVDQRNQQNNSALALPSDKTAKQSHVQRKRGNKNL